MADITGTMAAADCTFTGWDHGWNETITDAYNQVRVTEPLITEDIMDVARSLGTSLEGLQYSVKTASSVEDRLARMLSDWKSDRPFNPVWQMGRITDLIRYTEICRHDDIVDTTRKTIAKMEEKGYALTNLRNFFARPFKNTGYMGVHLTFVSPAGQKLELQVHSPESFEAKQKGHAMYEKIRSVSTMKDEKERLQAMVFAIHQSVRKPMGYEALQKYRMPPREEKELVKTRRKNLRVNIQKSQSHPGTMVYTVSMKGKPVLHGFECRFSDDSMWSYRNIPDRENAMIRSISADGCDVTSYAALPRRVSLGRAEQMTEEQEAFHAQWMHDNYPGGLDMDKEPSIAHTSRPDMDIISL